VPSLDGLRGLAVVAVVAFHAGHLQGGYLGVDLFFTVSGFLITRLILDDLARDRFRFGEFWLRRARRLLPALWALLAVVILVSPWLVAPSSGINLRRSVVATAIYIANWWQLHGPGSYWQALGTASPLNHTWSLAIEEQFYVVWPIVAVVVWRLARRPARALLGVALVAIAASIAAQALLFRPGTDGARAYLGTDTRAASILIGCAAAIALWARGRQVPPVVWHWLHRIAPFALAAIVVCWFVGRQGEWLYRGGFPLLALAAAIVLLSSGAPTPSRLHGVLSLAPLVLLGQVSYGIYLWHWPVFCLLGPDQLHVRGWVLLCARLLITAALVAASYMLIERPFRFKWGPLPLRLLGASACVVGVVAAVLTWPPVPQVSAARADQVLASWAAGQGTGQSGQTVGTTPPTLPPSGAAGASTGSGNPAYPASAAVPASETPGTTPPTVPEPSTTGTTTSAPSAPALPIATVAAPSVSSEAASAAPFPAPRRLLVLGDSVAYLLTRGFNHQAPDWMHVVDDGVVACTPGGAEHPQMRFDDGNLIRDPCADSLEKWPAQVRAARADGVLMVFGTSGLERQFGDVWRRPCDPVYDSWTQASLETRMRAVQASGARVWITLAAYNRHASITSALRPETDRETDCLNKVYATAAAQVGGVAVLDLRSIVCPSGTACVQQIDGIVLRPDGLHFEGPGGDLIGRLLLLSLGRRPTG
jgi:peptidoglycan/LPS O-acetylase OafA/YrhL